MVKRPTVTVCRRCGAHTRQRRRSVAAIVALYLLGVIIAVLLVIDLNSGFRIKRHPTMFFASLTCFVVASTLLYLNLRAPRCGTCSSTDVVDDPSEPRF